MFRCSLGSRILPRRVKRFRWYRTRPGQWYERARYGYSTVDLWNLDSYLATILASACPRLVTGDEEWNRDMKRMAKAFADYKVGMGLSERDEKRQERAIKLLAKNFTGLWV